MAPAPDESDLERDVEASASSPLLRPSAVPSRPSYRRRRISQSFPVPSAESYRSRWWVGVISGLIALLLAGIGVALVVVRSKRNNNPLDDTPQFSKLPGPQPGLRNPNFVSAGKHGAVASEVDVCSAIGVEVLKEGGTATDSAIATALCIGSTNMFSAGIGGGGFMVIRPSTSSPSFNPLCSEPISIDFREIAPAASSPHMFSPRPEDPSFDSARASKIGGLAVGVPGELRGFEAAYKLCGGGVSWERLVQPSADLARESKIGLELARRLARPVLSGFMLQEEHTQWGEMFAPDGDFLTAGGILRREKFAKTLETIGREGPGAFYEGPIAESIVKTVQESGGILTLEDMANYKAIVLPALESTYRNRTYYTGHYPSGGPILSTLLNILEGFENFSEEDRSGLATHRFIESLKFAFAARTQVGDPAYIKNEDKLAEVITKEYAARVRLNITDDRTHTTEYYHPEFDIEEDHGTTHLSVIDQYGSAVSLTSTVNLIFGSRVMDKETGIILNDEMDDFATPGIPDAFGLRPSPFNYPQGGKRPLSSTAPLIMDTPDGEVYLAIGGSGGSRIFGAVAQVILNLDWGMDIGNAVEQPRVHDQLEPAYVSIESGYRPDLINALVERGHNISMFDVNVGIAEVQAVLRTEKGMLFAASDSRKNGIPAAY